jgi:hypothetical protein
VVDAKRILSRGGTMKKILLVLVLVMAGCEYNPCCECGDTEMLGVEVEVKGVRSFPIAPTQGGAYWMDRFETCQDKKTLIFSMFGTIEVRCGLDANGKWMCLYWEGEEGSGNYRAGQHFDP